MAGRKKGKLQQAKRLDDIKDVLRPLRHGLLLDELAARFQVHPRTIKRDLDSLLEQGYDVEQRREDDGLRVTLRNSPLKPLDLSLSERYALMAVRRVFDVLEHTPLHDDVRSVYGKIVAGMSAEHRTKLEGFDERFVYIPDGGRKLYEQTSDLLDDLLTGVLHGSYVRYEYANAQGKVHGARLAPYAMVLYRQGLYILGCREGESVPRVFAVERFRSAKYERGKHFERPKDLRVDDFFEGAFGLFTGGTPTKVVIELTRDVAHAVRSRQWHPTQVVSELAGGGVRFEMQVSNLTQVLPWVLSWGASARVIEPVSLANEVRETARKLLGPGLASAKLRRKPRLGKATG